MGSRTAIVVSVALLVAAVAILASPWLLGSRPGAESDADLAAEVARLREEVAGHRDRIATLEERLGTGAPLARADSATAVAMDQGDDSGSDPGDEYPLPTVAAPRSPDVAPLMVQVGRKSIEVAGDRLSEDALAEKLGAHIATSPQAAVILRVAEGVPASRTQRIQDLARDQGITQIAVVREGTEKKGKKRKRRARKR